MKLILWHKNEFYTPGLKDPVPAYAGMTKNAYARNDKREKRSIPNNNAHRGNRNDFACAKSTCFRTWTTPL